MQERTRKGRNTTTKTSAIGLGSSDTKTAQGIFAARFSLFSLRITHSSLHTMHLALCSAQSAPCHASCIPNCIVHPQLYAIFIALVFLFAPAGAVVKQTKKKNLGHKELSIGTANKNNTLTQLNYSPDVGKAVTRAPGSSRPHRPHPIPLLAPHPTRTRLVQGGIRPSGLISLFVSLSSFLGRISARLRRRRSARSSGGSRTRVAARRPPGRSSLHVGHLCLLLLGGTRLAHPL